jgi:predicted regulator of Ras-like GTPase activity (Roadblock/LC7/MglB family)
MAPKKKKNEEENPSQEEKKETSKKEAEEKNEKLYESLKDIKTREGIIGFILRTPESASIDMKDPTKIIDYAVLSSTALEAGEDLSKTFELGEIQNVLLEGKDAKILSLKVKGQRLSVFMEKNIDHEEIYKDLNI